MSLDEKLDSFDKYRGWMYYNSYDDLNSVHRRHLPPDIVEADQKLFYSDYANEVNFWRFRENVRKARFYRAVSWWTTLEGYLNNSEDLHTRCWWHFVHQSDREAGMVAFTPSHAYGLADRQVRMKLGKYLKQFYGDILSDVDIKHLVNSHKDLAVQFATGREEIKAIYVDGPESCMSGDQSLRTDDEGYVHPAEVYGYQYTEGEHAGKYEFELAHIKIGDRITARSLCSTRHKVFTRAYGDDMDVLSSKLEELGYVKKAHMGELGLRLLHIPTEYGIVMPYLDGDVKRITLRSDSPRKPYWEWKAGGEYCGDSASGEINVGGEAEDDEDEDEDEDERWVCGCCMREFSFDDGAATETYESETVCTSCISNGFVHAIVNAVGDVQYISADNAVYNNSNDTYYREDRILLDRHRVVADLQGDYWGIDDLVEHIEGGWIAEEKSFECADSAHTGTIVCATDEVGPNWLCIDNDGCLDVYHPDYPPDDLQIEIVDDHGNLVPTDNRRYMTISEAVFRGYGLALKQRGLRLLSSLAAEAVTSNATATNIKITASAAMVSIPAFIYTTY